jgi:hypothetical protein
VFTGWWSHARMPKHVRRILRALMIPTNRTEDKVEITWRQTLERFQFLFYVRHH